MTERPSDGTGRSGPHGPPQRPPVQVIGRDGSTFDLPPTDTGGMPRVVEAQPPAPPPPRPSGGRPRPNREAYYASLRRSRNALYQEATQGVAAAPGLSRRGNPAYDWPRPDPPAAPPGAEHHGRQPGAVPEAPGGGGPGYGPVLPPAAARTPPSWEVADPTAAPTPPGTDPAHRWARDTPATADWMRVPEARPPDSAVTREPRGRYDDAATRSGAGITTAPDTDLDRPDAFGTGGFETGAFETGAFETGAFETGAFETATFGLDPAPTPSTAPHHAGAGRGGSAPTTDSDQGARRTSPGGGHRHRRRKRRHPIMRGFLAVLLVLLSIVGVSVGRALLAPGTDSVAARMAEWARDHGMSPVVTALENWQYNRHPPKVGGAPPPQPTLPAAANVHANEPSGAGTVTPPPPMKLFVTPGQPGEGTWKPLEVINGQPVVQVAYLRSDPVHTSYLSSVVWINQKYDRFVLHPGSQEPGGGPFSQPPQLGPEQRAGLLLTYNGGFKLADAKGGYYADGHTSGTLTNGAASEVFYQDGSMTVGAWGRDAVMGPNVAGVRQNLQLLVDNGVVNPQVDSNSEAVWGVTVANADFVWRSGVGVTASGDIVYAAGPALSVRTLAELLARAGAVRGMELDINADWVSCMSYAPSSDPGQVASPTKLLPFSRPADRYFQVSSRDFVAVYAR